MFVCYVRVCMCVCVLCGGADGSECLQRSIVLKQVVLLIGIYV